MWIARTIHHGSAVILDAADFVTFYESEVFAVRNFEIFIIYNGVFRAEVVQGYENDNAERKLTS